ncbi:MAG: 3'-5' exoribonuclease [Treponema sp.]|nr:3'-5' exoribonuclease [Treponema sp.]
MSDNDFQLGLFDEPEAPKASLDYIAIDFETANQNGNSACSVGLVRFIDGKESDSLYSLICPPSDYFVEEWIEKIHHLSYEDVKNEGKFPEVWDNKVLPFLQKTPNLPLVAHNAKFDMNVIWDCCHFYKHKLPDKQYFCSLALARKVWPEFEHHALTFLGGQFGIKYAAHEALDDSRTCGLVVALAAQKLGAKTVDQLLQKCKLKLEKV